MKTQLLLIALLVITAIFARCGKGDANLNDSTSEETPAILQKTPELVMAASSSDSIEVVLIGEATISFEVNVDWTISVEYKDGEKGWLTVAPGSGSAGKVEVLLASDANLPRHPVKRMFPSPMAGRYIR